MEAKRSSLDLVLILLLLGLAVALVDDRLIRAGITLVPALLLVQRAGVGGSSSSAAPEAKVASERRVDVDVRSYVDDLLKQIREFYSTCHLMTSGGLAPDAAKERATAIEKNLNLLLAKVTEASRG